MPGHDRGLLGARVIQIIINNTRALSGGVGQIVPIAGQFKSSTLLCAGTLIRDWNTSLLITSVLL